MNRFCLLISLLLISVPCYSTEVMQDEFVDEWFKDKEIKTVVPYSEYNYADTERIKIQITPVEKLSTPKNVYEGQVVNFVTKRNVRLEDGELLKKGTPVTGVVELYTTNGMTGVQGTITVGQISIPNLETDKLYYYIVKEGQNRTLWIMPIKWALTFIPFVGSVTNLIKGGQAVLSPSDTFTVYYYPNR